MASFVVVLFAVTGSAHGVLLVLVSVWVAAIAVLPFEGAAVAAVFLEVVVTVSGVLSSAAVFVGLAPVVGFVT